MIGLDTNVVIRWLIGDAIDFGQTSTHARLASRAISEEGPFFIDPVVFVEAVWVLIRQMRLPKGDVIDIVERMLNAANVVVDARTSIEGALARFAKGDADLADYLIGELNRHAGCETTLTFDKAAAKSPMFTLLTE